MRGSERVVVDTNVILRWLVKDHPGQFRQASSFFYGVRQKNYQIILPAIVFIEVGFVLKTVYGFDQKTVADTLGKLLSPPVISGKLVCDQYDCLWALKVHQKTGVKLVDCLIASLKVVRRGQTPIISFDKDFDKLGVNRLDPGDFSKTIPKTHLN